MGVGLGSVYFHSKMSEFSHWVDIIFISMTLLLSDYYIEKNRNNDNKFYYKCLLHMKTTKLNTLQKRNFQEKRAFKKSL